LESSSNRGALTGKVGVVVLGELLSSVLRWRNGEGMRNEPRREGRSPAQRGEANDTGKVDALYRAARKNTIAKQNKNWGSGTKTR